MGLLDINIKPNFINFMFESNYEKYLEMANILEAVFEALPMCII